jgi:hypothetical protein
MGKYIFALLLVTGVASAASADCTAVIDSSNLPEIDTGTLAIEPAVIGHRSPHRVPGVRPDLNDDGIPDLLLRGGPQFCGTGGCTWFLFDGRSGKPLGSLFGSTVVINATVIHGWSVLSAYANGGATSGTFSTFVHDGQQYVRVNSVQLHTESVTDLFNNLRAVAPGTPLQ